MLVSLFAETSEIAANFGFGRLRSLVIVGASRYLRPSQCHKMFFMVSGSRKTVADENFQILFSNLISDKDLRLSRGACGENSKLACNKNEDI